MALGIPAVITSPARGMREVAQRGALPGFVTVAAWVVVSLLSAGLTLLLGGLASTEELLESLPPEAVPDEIEEGSVESLLVGAQAVGIGLQALWPLLYWAVLALVMHLITRLFGGSGPLPGMFGAMGVACVPFVLSGLLWLPITGAQAALATGGEPGAVGVALGALGTLITLAALVWHVVLAVVGAAAARQISYGNSAGSCAISCAVAVGAPLLLLILVGVLLAVLGGAGG